MNQGVKPPGNKGQYKSITEGEIARARTQLTKNNTTTPPTATHQEYHHSQDHIIITKSPQHNQPCS
jgi:hypothetical protein